MTVTLPDRSRIRVPKGTPWLRVVEQLNLPDRVVAGRVLAVRVNGMLRDLAQPVEEDAEIEALTFDSPEGRDVYRHSSAHIMAQAVKTLFPGVKLAIGPPIDEGFYYDFDTDRPFTPEDLERIEQKMREIIAAGLTIERRVLTKDEALRLFEARREPYKLELIRELDREISVYSQGDFMDLCEGPHLPTTGWVRAVKLLSVAGAYWRGDERRPMLQRIYGASFETEEALAAHLKRLEEIKRRDHRRLARDLDLYSVHDEIGPGLIVWHPKGAVVRRVIEDFWKNEHVRAGYQLVNTPHIARRDLWARSGHLDFYRDYMYAPMEIEGTQYQLKPMNCPFHILIYQSDRHSYRDLPLRFAELGTVYRFERSGVLHGLMRVRGFTQDDAHLFCRPNDLEPEIRGVLAFIFVILEMFGFKEYEIALSTRPEQSAGTLADWERATAALRQALGGIGLRYAVDPGEGVFYGPKIDVKIKDVLGRAWQCATVQVDFNLPERFEMTYIGEDGLPHRPIMVHRALLGSLERFFGILIEHYAGAFPTWLAPVQVKILTITDRSKTYAEEVGRALRERGVRVETDLRNQKIGLKIRETEVAKVPYMLVLGDREAEGRRVAVRKRGGTDLGAMPLADFLALIESDLRVPGRPPRPGPAGGPRSS